MLFLSDHPDSNEILRKNFRKSITSPHLIKHNKSIIKQNPLIKPILNAI